MNKIAEIRRDVSAQYQGALLLGDVNERVNILKLWTITIGIFNSSNTWFRR